MILGLGSDLIDIRRVEQSIERFGDRFLDRIFTEAERLKSDKRAGRAASYAKRFAAKEACSKALGTGLRRGVFWRDMGVVNLPGGKPTLRLTGGALRRLEEAGEILHPGILAAEQPPLSYRALLHRHPRLHPQPGQPGRAAAPQLPLGVA